MKTSFGPKSNVIFVRISALLYSRAKFLTTITLLFGPNGIFIKSFRFLLTFSGPAVTIIKIRSFHQHLWNSEVETTLISLIGWPLRTYTNYSVDQTMRNSVYDGLPFHRTTRPNAWRYFSSEIPWSILFFCRNIVRKFPKNNKIICTFIRQELKIICWNKLMIIVYFSNCFIDVAFSYSTINFYLDHLKDYKKIIVHL